VYWPAAVHPNLREALLISFGVGVTASALTDVSSLERIDVVDISRDIFEMSSIIYPDADTHPLRDPRIRLHVEDGRHFLQTTERRYDLITGEPPPPKMAGIGNLYSEEYFTLVRKRLAPGGITTYWLPVHSLLPDDSRAIIRAFCNVFADCSLWMGTQLDWMLVGSRDATGPDSVGDFIRPWSDPRMGPNLRAIGIELPEQLGALFLGGPQYLQRLAAEAEPLTDDRPKRISDQLPNSFDAEAAYLPWMNLRNAQRRFDESSLVRRYWPEELRERTLPWFNVQFQAERELFGRVTTPARTLSELDVLLRTTPLRTLPLWKLGSGVRLQNLAEIAWGRGERDGFLEWHRAAGALVDRDYANAADRFGALVDDPDWGELAQLYAIYARCMEGQSERALSELEAVEMDTVLREQLRQHCLSPQEQTNERNPH
jgi:spermidine synthase